MNARSRIWWLGMLLLLAWIIFLWPTPSPEKGKPTSDPSASAPGAPSPSIRPLANRSLREPPTVPPGTLAEDDHATNILERLLIHNEWVRIVPSEEQIQAWLAANHTNAGSLLALRQAGAGLDYLKEAIQRHPNDPRVLAASLAIGDLDDSKRELLDRFKEAAPDNALAHYTSARDHFQNGNREQAINDLVAASTSAKFEDYVPEAIQDCEDLYLNMGVDPLEARTMACVGALLPHLSQLKGLAGDIESLQREYIAANDFDSAAALARYGMQLGRDLTSGSGSQTLIGQLVGIATEKIVIQSFERDTYYDFLGGTPAERLAELDAERAVIKRESEWIDAQLVNLNPDEAMSYFERFKMFGETAARTWLRERRPTPP